jgi:hypothetical protein
VQDTEHEKSMFASDDYPNGADQANLVGRRLKLRSTVSDNEKAIFRGCNNRNVMPSDGVQHELLLIN